MKIFGYLDDLVSYVLQLPTPIQLVILGMVIMLFIWLVSSRD